MEYRVFGRTGWKVSEIGYGMWGMGAWSGSDDRESGRSLDLAVELGCNFFDTAWVYGNGKSEKLLGNLLKRHPGEKLYIATKIPTKDFVWPPKKGCALDDCFPPENIVEYTEKSLANLGVETIDLMQFHAWEDNWTSDERWQKEVEKLKRDGKIRAIGISINRWEPNNCLEALKTGLIDVVQVVYNIFDQAPEDELFPLCEKMNIGIIARVPFDEGGLTGGITKDTKFPKDDWRSFYFSLGNLMATVERTERLRPIIPQGMSMVEMALRFVLSNKSISTTIPGMRREKHVRANIGTSDGKGLPQSLLAELKKHRWDREPKWLL